MPCTRTGIPLRSIPAGDGHGWGKEMMTMKHICALAVAVLGAAIPVIATELPGYDDLQTTIGKAVSVVEVWVKEVKTSSKVDGPNTLEVLAQVKEAVAGEKIEGEIRGKYEEFHAPGHPEIHVSYANYTGSGQELRTRANDRVLLLVSGRGKEDMFAIVRIEPVEKKKEIQELFAKKDRKPQPTAGGDGKPAPQP